MFGGSPFYRSYNPSLHSSYQPPQSQYSPFDYSPYQNARSVDLDRARAIAAQRARRAQWLPDEYDDDDGYDSHQLSPRERAYLNAHRNHTLMEREQERREYEAEEARRRLEDQKWQQELDRKQKEDEAARKRVEEERFRRRQQVPEIQSPIPPHADDPQQQQKHTGHTSHSGRSSPPPHSIPIADGSIPQPEQRPSSPQQSQPSPRSTPAQIQYDEKHVEAASVLQRFFRIRQSIQAIQSLVSEFDTVRKDFTWPSTISFQNPLPSSTEVVNIAAADPSSVTKSSSDDIDSNAKIPKLAFNSTNYGILAYNDALDKLLVKLDGVESWGDVEVRRRRRNVVKLIEKEQALVDRFWKTSWLKHVEEKGEWVDGDMLVA